MGNDFRIRSICHVCIESMNKMNTFQRDEFGRALDPATQNPLLTCTCGRAVLSIDSCKINWMYKTPDHKMIRPQTN
jgi:hypothetical protein